MRYASMITAILQAATLHTLNYVLTRYITTDSFWSVLTEDPVLQDYNRASKVYWDARLRNQSFEHPDKGTTEQTTRLELPESDANGIGEDILSVPSILDAVDSAGGPTNGSGSHAQPEVNSANGPTEITVALGWLRTFFIDVLLGPLIYTWHIWLERLLPSRRSARQRDSAYQASKEKETDGDDVREEQIIQKWLRQGKIRRPSLSWRNTFAKWAIQWTVGRYWIDNAVWFLTTVLKRDPPSASMLIPNTYLSLWIVQRMSIAPFGTILCFMLVPAPKRLPFLQGVALLWTAFIALFLYLITPMVVQMEFVQELLSNLTNSYESESLNIAHTLDEL
ncbi:hypothetical protein F5Y08DRAFT_310266 [Xylaria arbuscula]|nr:hypothetical protein F5Y08DRAFT_310266 [Xylaria arbuscula]